ncbi:unnamed protein product [Mesocestoides corti]|uniref:Uncharacterized protein n=1 Tax=Mesocestoides corti TaxID=53468 RepID=A0A3P6HC98_MESCO|nr:unnamed protein product [Mesocestoides corti]
MEEAVPTAFIESSDISEFSSFPVHVLVDETCEFDVAQPLNLSYVSELAESLNSDRAYPSLACGFEDVLKSERLDSSDSFGVALPSGIRVPLSGSDRLHSDVHPALPPLSDLLVPVSHPTGMDVCVTEESTDYVELHLGLTHNDHIQVEQATPIDYALMKASSSRGGHVSRDIHVGISESTSETIVQAKSFPDCPSPTQAIAIETGDHLSALPGVCKASTDEAAVYIDENGSEKPIKFSLTTASESAKPLAVDQNLTSATFVAVTESEHVDSFSASQRKTSLPEIVSADKCLKRHLSSSSLGSLLGSVQTPPRSSRFSDSSLEIRPKVPRRLFYAADTQEVIWEEVVLFDNGQESPLPFPSISLIVPIAEPNLSIAPQHSVIQDRKEGPFVEVNDLIPSYASLPRPKSKEIEICGAVLGASAPEIRSDVEAAEPSGEMMNLLSSVPISSAPVSSEVVVSDIPPTVESLSSPAIASSTKSPEEQTDSELDVWILSRSSSEEETKTIPTGNEEDTLQSSSVADNAEILAHEKEKEVTWDYLPQLAAAAGATLAAEYASGDDEDDDDEDDDDYDIKSIGLQSRLKMPSMSRPAPQATLDRSSQLLSRLKFYGLGSQQAVQPTPRLFDVERGPSRVPDEGEALERQVAEEVILEDEGEEEEEVEEEESPKITVEDLDDSLPPIPEVAGPLTPDEDGDSLNDDELPTDLKLVPAHEDDDDEEDEDACSSSYSRPVSEYHQQRQSLSRLSASSQPSSFAATATDTTEESSQATMIFVGSEALKSLDQADETFETMPSSLDNDPSLLAQTQTSASGSFPRLPGEGIEVSAQGPSALAASLSTDQVTDDKPCGSRHLAEIVSTPSILERSTSSGIYFPQKGRLHGFPSRGDPGASEPVLSKTEAADSQSASLIEFERLEQQMIANSSPDSIQKTSSERRKSSSSKASSSLSEFERIEADAAKSSSASSGDLPSRTKIAEDSSQSSLSEFLREEQACASSQESVHQQPPAHKPIDTIYEDILAEQMCQSLETSRQTDSSEVAGDADSLAQSSIHDSLAGSSSQRESLPIDRIRDVIRGARDVLEQRFSRDHDSLGEADSSEGEDFPQFMETSADSLEALHQHSQQARYGDSSLSSELNYSRQMTDSLEDSGAAMASGSRASTQPPSQSEALFLPFTSPAPPLIMSTELPQMSIPRSTSNDEALLKKADTEEESFRRFPVSASSTSLNLGQVLAPISPTDSNLGSTVFDVSEDEFKGSLNPKTSTIESPLKSQSSSPVIIHRADTKDIPEIASPVTPMAGPFSPKDFSSPLSTELGSAVEEETEEGFEVINLADVLPPPEPK